MNRVRMYGGRTSTSPGLACSDHRLPNAESSPADNYPSAGYVGLDVKIGVGAVHIAAAEVGP